MVFHLTIHEYCLNTLSEYRHDIYTSIFVKKKNLPKKCVKCATFVVLQHEIQRIGIMPSETDVALKAIYKWLGIGMDGMVGNL